MIESVSSFTVLVHIPYHLHPFAQSVTVRPNSIVQDTIKPSHPEELDFFAFPHRTRETSQTCLDEAAN